MEPKGMSKSELRNHYRRERELTYIPGSWLHILASAEFNGVARIASYLSYGTEPDTAELNRTILAKGIDLVIPAMQSDKSLLWYSWNGEISSLKKKGKIYEPSDGTPIDPASIDVVIVPTLHANRSGFRLGQGGGSYDRALTQIHGWKIGLIYSGELTAEELPIESHDQKLDAVATPEMIVRFTAKNS
ncbi:MAG: 5-formyltetrahydrofolate cyclo-ligase [Actinobacteria bacterium]|nr:5-formyltetrahydrofolate cyclo-ligase [Actinomycetota bacterium]MSW98553.1 5-formyltetrahydrofolate cyclo-ligase [Actinomycetota bacterium]MSY82268.1 5-formyltetrahydrofolate cyclo-ligase [Actinomycetota bacterium]MSZ45651.1 5-formyltetrahydrofolate cyclo-ligase [Actinomycetota bacterium]MTA04224.1 5-formyltetrahydrofolate cyclo-ligase [Actinomycetota bacterium]